jgi:tellurite resistance protein
MFRRIFGPGPEHEQAADATEAALNKAGAATGDTKTVQYVVAQLEALPPERARLVASAAYTLARAAQADLDVSDEEMAVIQDALQTRGALDESTAHLVAELVKLQARTVGGTEDYVVVREFAGIATDQQKQDILRACFLVSAASGSISAEESAEVNQIANELALEPAVLNSIRAEFHDLLTSVQAVRKAAGGA